MKIIVEEGKKELDTKAPRFIVGNLYQSSYDGTIVWCSESGNKLAGLVFYSLRECDVEYNENWEQDEKYDETFSLFHGKITLTQE